ncbi:hypothetical protein CH371_20055 [Leptospira wolffii]|uniref:Phage abortive infection protein n=1 Tax=Leptospira wolffii TaxID=409998 RepID=A0A2M9Z6L3_9LEPT|nr:hypothetical protein [Leptospira wolffii]PJZ64071.1 hypothetical protein CH371_20055 [Leptospira wolffii]
MFKIAFLYIISIISFLAGIVGVVILATQLLNVGYGFDLRSIEINETNQIAGILQGVIGTIWIFTTISLLFLTNELQKKELRATNKFFQQQNDDSHYFNLINLFTDIQRNVELLYEYIDRSIDPIDNVIRNTTIYKGKKYFENAAWCVLAFFEFCETSSEKTKTYLQNCLIPFGRNSDIANSIKARSEFNSDLDFCAYNLDKIRPVFILETYDYVSLFIEILKFIAIADRKDLYLNYIRGVLSPMEQSFLFYMLLADVEGVKIAKELKFFSKLPSKLLANEVHVKFYQ